MRTVWYHLVKTLADGILKNESVFAVHVHLEIIWDYSSISQHLHCRFNADFFLSLINSKVHSIFHKMLHSTLGHFSLHLGLDLEFRWNCADQLFPLRLQMNFELFELWIIFVNDKKNESSHVFCASLMRLNSKWRPGDEMRWPGLNRLCHNCGDIVKLFPVKEVSKETVEVDLSPSLSLTRTCARARTQARTLLPPPPGALLSVVVPDYGAHCEDRPPLGASWSAYGSLRFTLKLSRKKTPNNNRKRDAFRRVMGNDGTDPWW